MKETSISILTRVIKNHMTSNDIRCKYFEMKIVIISLLSVFPVIGFAHEGHGVVEHGPAHYALSVEHFFWASLLIVLILFTRWVWIKKFRDA